MSYFTQEFIFTIQSKMDSEYTSNDSDYIAAKVEVLKKELETILKNKIEIKIEYN